MKNPLQIVVYNEGSLIKNKTAVQLEVSDFIKWSKVFQILNPESSSLKN